MTLFTPDTPTVNPASRADAPNSGSNRAGSNRAGSNPSGADGSRHVPADLLEPAIEGAMRRIAPAWPLDRFIAVNPLWGQADRPLRDVAHELRSLSGARMVMPRSWYREELEASRIERRHVARAIEESKSGQNVQLEDLLDWVQRADQPRPRRARVVDVADSFRDLSHEASWRQHVTTQVSQFCASYFDDGQSTLKAERTGGLYASWRRLVVADQGPRLLMGCSHFSDAANQLPLDATTLIPLALEELQVRPDAWETYLAGLLLDLGGWAAWCTYQRFTAQQRGEDDASVHDLLGILVAWEWLLMRVSDQRVARSWELAKELWPGVDRAATDESEEAWLMQRAVELAWQERIEQRLPLGFDTERRTQVTVQAAFCIDVRSEVFRRALEAQTQKVETLGFAGFFGLPADYMPAGASTARPQLPGPLAPKLRVTDEAVADSEIDHRHGHLAGVSSWKSLRKGAASTFLFVEALGVGYGLRLLKDTFTKRRYHHVDSAGLTDGAARARKPRLIQTIAGEPLTSDERADLAAGMLRAMSLTHSYGRLVLLAGHGSQTRNNPHAAGLDCGACCGQTGEVNARATAALLNEPEVRVGLAERGIIVPPSTHFLAGLHNTTTDEVELFDLDEVPASHGEDVTSLQDWLARAGARARRERAERLQLSPETPDHVLLSQIQRRTGDWAQVRPEWGLADNAGFIVAPRERTRHMSLEGQCFLHDYRFEEDEDFGILELIMTAPMVVTHWINFQYYASTVDNQRYGSGNKVLHNVVGGHIGVFEGNGGDLRTGLSLQSLHDGERWVHTPRRLSVYIEAPREAIDGVLEKHDHVRALATGEWLHLFQIDPRDRSIHAYTEDGWAPRTTPGQAPKA